MSLPRDSRLPGEGVSVVVVDDHTSARTQLSQVLAAHGFNVLALAATSAEGRRAIEELRPEVAVIDNRLPDGFGADLCVDLADTCPDVVKVLHTGSISVEQAEFASTHGAAAVVMKSARPRLLIDTINALMDTNGTKTPPTAGS